MSSLLTALVVLSVGFASYQRAKAAGQWSWWLFLAILAMAGVVIVLDIAYIAYVIPNLHSDALALGGMFGIILIGVGGIVFVSIRLRRRSMPPRRG